ncbi:uncharacterized protein (TIGR02145 family) [Dysgonomonas sp. PH5-45]|uniref:hypothetical protein n=1 Tax=unclassified Dysgonomonas TaxID=2630389 RepID=UPI002473F50D|nr:MULTISPECIES: hypothetical protein [unclassified Dysgonomonas]MDH6355621.1 uncharacterized protein (TIGR02145 family) [Dysgonomonas sp. PH5-45]MDH6388518.1 uncharacterized protein (TIGR02145 family) [Dysgonomonas sp. PH5-37]
MKLYKPLILPFLLLTIAGALHGQVTIGSDLVPMRAALLDLKAQEPDVNDNYATVAAGHGGLLLPRVRLEDITILEPFYEANNTDFINNTNSLKQRLVGLTVYNLTDNSSNESITDPNKKCLSPGVYTWNGITWATSKVDLSASANIITQPKAFTFYENIVNVGDIDPLEFSLKDPDSWTYQWYQIVSNNLHVKIGTAIDESGVNTVGGSESQTHTFTPTGIKKDHGLGTTRNAKNTGIYKFYCEATKTVEGKTVTITSDIAEVAVGCGAKTVNGEWLSFMCFNLGAKNNSTIEGQKNYSDADYDLIYPFTNTGGSHTYKTGEEKLYGSYFQWGRIADGHEKPNSATHGYSSGVVIADGILCSASESDAPRPWQQVKKETDAYGKFITGGPNTNWLSIQQANADQLWRTGRFVSNDPCAHYKEDGNFLDIWGAEACSDAGTGWRTPTRDEWCSIYRGSSPSGGPSQATANKWIWYGGTISNDKVEGSGGYEIKPDWETPTLVLPASGGRNHGGGLHRQDQNGYYWSSTVYSTGRAYYLAFFNGSINAAADFERSRGLALRCIKDDSAN